MRTNRSHISLYEYVSKILSLHTNTSTTWIFVVSLVKLVATKDEQMKNRSEEATEATFSVQTVEL